MNNYFDPAYYAQAFNLAFGGEIRRSTSGACYKVEGLTYEQCHHVIPQLQGVLSGTKLYLLQDVNDGDTKISPSKLVQLRNDKADPFVVFIPTGKAFGAADSFNSSTFRELDNEVVVNAEIELLTGQLPLKVRTGIQKLWRAAQASLTDIIDYLHGCRRNRYTDNAIVGEMWRLGVIPDKNLLDSTNFAQNLDLNQRILKVALDRTGTPQQRVQNLQLRGVDNALVVESISAAHRSKAILKKRQLLEKIGQLAAEIPFRDWVRKRDGILLVRNLSVELEAAKFEIEDGEMPCCRFDQEVRKLSIMVRPEPELSELPELNRFLVELIKNDGSDQQGVLLTQAKVTGRKTNKKKIPVTINVSQIEEGATYRFLVYPLDKNGALLMEEVTEAEILGMAPEHAEVSPWRVDLPAFRRRMGISEPFTVRVEASDVEEESEESESAQIDSVMRAEVIELSQREEEIPSMTEGEEMSYVPQVKVIDGSTSDSRLTTVKVKIGDRSFDVHASDPLRLLERKLWDDESSRLTVVLQHGKTLNDVYFERFEVADVSRDADRKLNSLRKTYIDQLKSLAKETPLELAALSSGIFVEPTEKYLAALYQYIEQGRGESSQEGSHAGAIAAAHTLRDCVELTIPRDKGSERYMLLSPSHPMNLAFWLDYAKTFMGQLKSDSSSERMAQLAADLRPSAVLSFLPGKSGTVDYHYVAELGSGWLLYAPSIDMAGKERAIDVRSIRSRVAKALGVSKNLRIESDINWKMLKQHLRSYYDSHHYLECLVINIVSSGSLKPFVDAIVKFDTEIRKDPNKPNGLRYEVHIFGTHEGLDNIAEDFAELLNPSTTPSDDAAYFQQVGRNRLFPKIRYSVSYAENKRFEMQKFSANLTFLVAPFVATPRLVNVATTALGSSFRAGGLASASHRIHKHNEDGDAWYTFEVCAENPRSFTERLYSQYQRILADGLGADSPDLVPASMVEFSSDDTHLLDQAHQYSDWVVIYDRHIGPEYFDRQPRSGVQSYLLDYLPGEKLTDVSSFVTAKPRVDVDRLIRNQFESLGPIGRKLVDQEILEAVVSDIRSISGSLLLKIKPDGKEKFEFLGDVAVLRLLRTLGLSSTHYLFPIDLHHGQFGSTKAGKLTDLVLISFDFPNKTVGMNVVEVKVRANLETSEYEGLLKEFEEELSNTEKQIRKKYSHLCGDTTDSAHMDKELQQHELADILMFYLRRSLRFKLLETEHAAEAENFLKQPTNIEAIALRSTAILFDLSSKDDILASVRKSSKFFFFGPNVFQKLFSRHLEQDVPNHADQTEEMI